MPCLFELSAVAAAVVATVAVAVALLIAGASRLDPRLREHGVG